MNHEVDPMTSIYLDQINSIKLELECVKTQLKEKCDQVRRLEYVVKGATEHLELMLDQLHDKVKTG